MAYKKTFIILFSAALIFLARGIINRRNILASQPNPSQLKAAKSSSDKKGYVAIIIDDFGYDGEGTEEMLNIKVPFTAAVMPFSEKSAENIARLDEAKIEYIIHMPMQSLTGRPEWVGKGIYTNMSNDQISERINEAFEIEPNAVGMNNHMGSAIMENERCIRCVLDELKRREMPFIDSMTSQKSKATAESEKDGCMLMKRNVFLDSTNDINHVKKMLKKAEKAAIEKGACIAIGHVGPEGGKITAKAINDMYAQMEENGVQFITVSQMKEYENENGNADKQVR